MPLKKFEQGLAQLLVSNRSVKYVINDIQMAKIQAEAGKEMRADEIQMTQIVAAEEQAKIEAEQELALKELELKAQQDQDSTSPAAAAPPPSK